MKKVGPQERIYATATWGIRIALAVITKRIDAFRPKVNTRCPQEVTSR
jgi:hypothetical protein